MHREPIWRRYARLLGSNSEGDVDEEIAFHLSMRESDLRGRGMSEEAARERAEREFGDVGRIRGELNDISRNRAKRERRGNRVESLMQDVRFSLRTMARSRSYSGIAIGTLALGIAGTTTLFSMVNGVLLRALPIPQPDRVVQLWQSSEDAPQSTFSYLNFRDVEGRSRSFEAMLAYRTTRSPVSYRQTLSSLDVTSVHGDFPGVYEVRPVVGRWFSEEEARRGEVAAVVDFQFWQTQMGARGELAGEVVRIGERSVEVIGVMPEGFDFPAGSSVWIPRDPMRPEGRTGHNWLAVARLADGATISSAGAELNRVGRELKAEYGDDTWMVGGEVVPLLDQIVGRSRPALLMLFGASLFLLLIACANVVNLLLARGEARRGEIGVRNALGATRSRIAQQLFTEALMICVFAGVLGLGLSWVGIRILPVLEPGRIPRLGEVGIDLQVLLFALGLSVAAAAGITLFTVLRQTGGTSISGLRGEVSGRTTSAEGSVIGRLLIALQVAICMLLLIGAGLLARSFVSVLAIDPGYRTSGPLVATALFGSSEDMEVLRRQSAQVSEISRRLSQLPGVERVGVSTGMPLSGGGGSNGTFLIQQTPDEITSLPDFLRVSEMPERTGFAQYRIADGEFFRAMGIPLIRGRLFDGGDDAGAPHVAVINESLAQQRWPDENPLGKLIQYANMDLDIHPYTIVGIVADIRDRSLESEPEPTLYGNASQRFTNAAGPQYFVIEGGDDDLGQSARNIIAEVAPDVPSSIGPLADLFSDALATRRFSMLLLGLFALCALTLAIAGIYGMMAFMLTQRRREFGIRLALGATRARIAGRALMGTMALVMAGIAVGLISAFWSSRILEAMLFGVSGRDTVTFVGVPFIVLLLALLAGVFPAVRSTRLEPSVVLRSD